MNKHNINHFITSFKYESGSLIVITVLEKLVERDTVKPNLLISEKC